MKITNRKLDMSSIVHGLAYTLIIINLFFMNLNVLIGKPIYFMTNISLSLLAILFGVIVLYMRKGIDSTPVIGILINVYSIVIVVGTLFFYES
ncbi:hypothetical protein ACFPTR_13760 [Aliibacillus thermotolerans]|jgi:hypothetical protein|uniref:Uncharacterized protein n=1 Tax=Aliibacillus thermotolerans TaxID=1834418 RepID=A0ABW0UAS8_9BACI|nr:hypothetical protein [Aliibacillus thermotolerans]MDA3130859.1 hypothetical protein [Aliibacillus thermotolerans]